MSRIPWGDLEYARRWRGLVSTALLAEVLGCSELELLLALGSRARARPWTRAEDEVLRREYPGGDTEQLARYLRRSSQSVKNRTHKLGLLKTVAWRRRHRALRTESWKRRKSSGATLRNAVSLRDRNLNEDHGGTTS